MAPASSSAAALATDDRVPTFCNYIGGEWTGAGAENISDDINPADTRDVVGRFPASSANEATDAVHAAERALSGWRGLSMSSRAKILNRAANHLEAHCEDYAREMTREMGKLLALAKDEILRSAQTLRFYAIEGQTLAGETFHNDDGDMEVYTRREPLGVVAVITPWNFPVSIPARKIAPALITGNTVVFKPSSDAPLSGLRLVEAFAEAGIPNGVLNLITGSSSDVGGTITTAAPIRAISFTGSTAAGEHIHRSVSFTTRTQMELGGKNPLIVMDDADLDKAVDLAVKGGLSLSGQACTGTSRVLVIKDVKDAFLCKLVAKVKGLKIGNGLLPGIDIGPLATARQFDTVLSYIEIGKREGTLLCGGERLSGPEYEYGYFISPAIFSDVSNDARIAREEIFGPVIAVIEAESYADAIAKANASEYGLSAAIATGNARVMNDFVRDIESGTVKINRTTTGNLINAPFGGLKRSSTSTFREAGRTGLEFYTQIKTVYRGC